MWRAYETLEIIRMMHPGSILFNIVFAVVCFASTAFLLFGIVRRRTAYVLMSCLVVPVYIITLLIICLCLGISGDIRYLLGFLLCRCIKAVLITLVFDKLCAVHETERT